MSTAAAPAKVKGFQILQPETTLTGTPIEPVHRGLPKITQSLCPDCLRIIEAHVFEENGRVMMEKTCPLHGFFRDVVFSDARLYLKMDTQGYDLAVVEGAGATLGRVLALQTEVALQPLYQDMRTTLCNTVPELRKRGFEVTGLFPVTRDKKDGLQIIELDCVMIRSRTVSAPMT